MRPGCSPIASSRVCAHAWLRFTATAELGQVEYRNLFLFQKVMIGFLLRINNADARHSAPDKLRETQCPVILGHEQCKSWPGGSHSLDLPAKDINIDIGRDQE